MHVIAAIWPGTAIRDSDVVQHGFPEIPCTLGGAPVAMEMLLGQVKLGMPQWATALKPLAMNRAMAGITPACWAAVKYAGAPPSTQITANRRIRKPAGHPVQLCLQLSHHPRHLHADRIGPRPPPPSVEHGEE